MIQVCHEANYFVILHVFSQRHGPMFVSNGSQLTKCEEGFVVNGQGLDGEQMQSNQLLQALRFCSARWITYFAIAGPGLASGR